MNLSSVNFTVRFRLKGKSSKTFDITVYTKSFFFISIWEELQLNSSPLGCVPALPPSPALKIKAVLPAFLLSQLGLFISRKRGHNSAEKITGWPNPTTRRSGAYPRLDNRSPPPSLYSIANLLPDLKKGFQNTAFWEKDRIQSETTYKGPPYSFSFGIQ